MNDLNPQFGLRLAIRSFAIWLVLVAAEIAHGILRAIVLVPLVGEFRSNQIGVVTGSLIILAIAYLTIHWIAAKLTWEMLMVGAFWLVLMATFEMLFGRYVMGLTWQRIGADYNIAQGGFMPLALLALFFSPMIASRLRDKR
jgi:hypothetical protein